MIASISVASEPEVQSETGSDAGSTFDPNKRRTPLGKSPDIAEDAAKGKLGCLCCVMLILIRVVYSF